MEAGQERERRLPRIVWKAMTSPYALPVLGVSILAAAAAGIHLGESAVASINPIYFQGPALHPRERGAAIDERSLALARAQAPQVYGWDQGYAARDVDREALAARDAQAYSAGDGANGRGQLMQVIATRIEDEPTSVQLSWTAGR